MNEAELLFTRILGCSRMDLYLNKDLRLDACQAASVSGALKRRFCQEPLQYILGKAEFMGLEFIINNDVFIPRPETEILVEAVIKLVSKYQSIKVSGINIMDLGTGSGCIAVSVAKYLDNIRITATDISEKALQVARINARINRVEDKIVFLRSNLFEAICDKRYALCICNPPYIPTREIDNLQPEISYEPRIALDGGDDGLDFYRRIITAAPRYLKAGGFLIMEMGFGQRRDVENIFKGTKNFKIDNILKDYSGIDRVIVALKRGGRWIN